MTSKEVEKLSTFENLREIGVSIIYVSHRWRRSFGICDRITILKEGSMWQRWTGLVDKTTLVSLKIGGAARSDSFFPPLESESATSYFRRA
jgi:ABC-type sugar transport system ATPase subunit